MKLSYREKIVLLITTVIITLFVGIIVVIKPKIEAVHQASAVLAEKKAQMDELNKKITESGDLDQKLQNAYNDGKALSDFFLPEMSTYQTDQYISQILKASNVSFSSLNLVPMTATDMAFYTYDINNPEYALRDAADLSAAFKAAEADSSSVSTEDSSETQAPPQLPAKSEEQPIEQAALSTVSIEFTATKNDLKAFLDTIDNLNKAVIVTGCTIEDFTVDTISGSMTINLYSVSQISEPQPATGQ